jgi:hypothetical protein
VSDSAGFVSSRMVPIKAMAVLRKGAGALKPKHDGSNRISKSNHRRYLQAPNTNWYAEKRSASASPTETTIAAILAGKLTLSSITTSCKFADAIIAKPALKPAPSKLLGGLWDPKNRPEIRCVRVKKAGSRGTRKLVFD